MRSDRIKKWQSEAATYLGFGIGSKCRVIGCDSVLQRLVLSHCGLCRDHKRHSELMYNQAAMEKLRRRFDPQYKITMALRSRMNSAIRNKQKSGSAVADLGCSIEQFMRHLEAKFKPGMSWENWGLDGWHIDHIMPLASFDLTDREQFLKAAHYKNFQPLWAHENFCKSDKIPEAA